MTTVAELRAILAAMLADLLGDYTTPSGHTLPAIRVGDPPSDYRVSGLECRIAKVPTVDQVPAYQAGSLSQTHRVRLVSHGNDDNQFAALKLISSRWPDVSFQAIPANESLGILSQHTVDIPA